MKKQLLSPQASILLHYCPSSLLCVLVGACWGCLAMGCRPTADHAWNQVAAFQPSWCFWASSSPPAAQPRTAGCPPPGHTFCRQVCAYPCPGEGSGPFLQPEVCTAASLCSSSICMEASAHHQGYGAASPAGAISFVLRWVPPSCLKGQVGWVPLMVAE